MLCYTVVEASKKEDGQKFVDRARRLLRARQFEQFEDALFEAEAALYWDQQRPPVESVQFARSGHHPDFWITARVGRCATRIPVECKRLQPHAPDETTLEMLGAYLAKELHDIVETLAPGRMIIWLHDDPVSFTREELVASLRRVVERAVTRNADKSQWTTECVLEGRVQISFALAGDDGELLPREIRIPDVPIRGPLHQILELKHDGTPHPPVRLHCVLSLRSDALPSRIGAFERNLYKAVQQIANAPTEIPGIVCMRLRPPRALGDLFEADGIVRRLLREKSCSHIALVALFWNEDERIGEDARSADDRSAVRQMRHLKAHFISNPLSQLNFNAIDSSVGAFPPFGNGVMLRDPDTGSITPVPERLFEALEKAVGLEGSDDDSGAATLYMKLAQPLPPNVELGGVGVIKAGKRAFVPFLSTDENLRVVEFRGRVANRQATLDLRALRGEHDLLVVVRWDGETWSVAARSNDAMDPILAQSVPVPRVFL
jgi:hypothetical protein